MKAIKDCFDMCNENIRRVLGVPKRKPLNVPVGQCALPTRPDEVDPTDERDDFDIERIVFDFQGAF